MERQAKVGFNLSRLKILKEQLNRALQESVEFNERIEDPIGWQKKVRERQQEESIGLQNMRDDQRWNLVKKSSFIVEDVGIEKALGKRKMT